ncbi:MAG: hypothetical protein AB1405_16660 [Bdellovibrionota bacterium]
MKHFATPDYWACYRTLPEPVQEVADKNFALLKDNPKHPSLHFKKVGRFFSVRVGRIHRALGVEDPEGIVWFWIGHHAEYERLLSS